MHELDNDEVCTAVIASLGRQLNVTGIKKIAVGNEFYVFKAHFSTGPVVIKVPKNKVFSNVNDNHIDAQILIDQEFKLSRYAMEAGIDEIAKPILQLEASGYPALVLEFIPSDDSKPDQFELGRLLARIHTIAVPDFELSAQEGMSAPELVVNRLARRWNELDKLIDDLPNLPNNDILNQALASTHDEKQLLHMDFREANFRMLNGFVLAVLDWSNSLLGHPALELARIAETGETNQEFIDGYASVRPIPEVNQMAEVIFRLDTATMLALVFLSEDPDPVLAHKYVERVHELHMNLSSGRLQGM